MFDLSMSNQLYNTDNNNPNVPQGLFFKYIFSLVSFATVEPRDEYCSICGLKDVTKTATTEAVVIDWVTTPAVFCVTSGHIISDT